MTLSPHVKKAISIHAGAESGGRICRVVKEEGG
jgi:hypothetical protein